MDKTFRVDYKQRTIKYEQQIENSLIAKIESLVFNEEIDGLIIEDEYLHKFLCTKVSSVIDKDIYVLKQLTDNQVITNKHSKIDYRVQQIERLIRIIGFENAQKLHAEDKINYSYQSMREFLKINKHQFKQVYLYEKDFEDNYKILRHKNLFSKYGDEISDFERLTKFERTEQGQLKVTYELDENIFEYDDSKATLDERKFTREFAKDIYNKKNLFSERELFEILKSKDVYIEITTITPKENKEVWSKVKIEDMDIRILFENLDDFRKSNVPQFKKRKYMSKKQKRSQRRAQDKVDNINRLKEYYTFY